MKKSFLHILPVSVSIFLFVTVPALAQNSAAEQIKAGLKATGEESGAGYSTLPIEQLIGQLIQVVLGIVGVLFLVLTVYAGVLWMTAGGTSKNVETAKGILRNSVIGLVIIIAAYALTKFIVDKLVIASGSG